MAQVVAFPEEPAARMRLVCPAGTPPSLKAAVDNGAENVYLGFKGVTNARSFTGLNFDDRRIREGIEYAHRARVLVVEGDTKIALFVKDTRGLLCRAMRAIGPKSG